MKTLSKQISYFVGIIAMFAGGIIFVLLSDLYIKNTSTWLIVSALLSFGSAACALFSENFEEKIVFKFMMKGFGVALGIGFVLFLHLFPTTDFYVSTMKTLQADEVENALMILMANITMILSLVLGYLGLAGQIVNGVISATIKEE